jgi:hypothetical protein
MDKFGNTCAAYDALGFCHAGKVLAKATAFDLENGWNRANEMGGSKACCACGGGEAIDRRPTDAHGVTPPPPDAATLRLGCNGMRRS